MADKDGQQECQKVSMLLKFYNDDDDDNDVYSGQLASFIVILSIRGKGVAFRFKFLYINDNPNTIKMAESNS